MLGGESLDLAILKRAVAIRRALSRALTPFGAAAPGDRLVHLPVGSDKTYGETILAMVLRDLIDASEISALRVATVDETASVARQTAVEAGLVFGAAANRPVIDDGVVIATNQLTAVMNAAAQFDIIPTVLGRVDPPRGRRIGLGAAAFRRPALHPGALRRPA